MWNLKRYQVLPCRAVFHLGGVYSFPHTGTVVSPLHFFCLYHFIPSAATTIACPTAVNVYCYPFTSATSTTLECHSARPGREHDTTSQGFASKSERIAPDSLPCSQSNEAKPIQATPDARSTPRPVGLSTHTTLHRLFGRMVSFTAVLRLLFPVASSLFMFSLDRAIHLLFLHMQLRSKTPRPHGLDLSFPPWCCTVLDRCMPFLRCHGVKVPPPYGREEAIIPSDILLT